MEKNYKITIKSTSGTADSESICIGSVSDEYGEKILTYTNYDGDFSYDTKIVIGKEIVSIINYGKVESVMNLEKDTFNQSEIKTEFGNIPVKVKLNHIVKEFSDSSLYLSVDYEALFSDYQQNFKIEIQAEKLA